MIADIVAAAPGQIRPVLNVHAHAERAYTVDLSRLLRPGEMLAGSPEAMSPTLAIGSAQILGPAMMATRIGPAAIAPGRPYADHDLSLSARTTTGGRVACTITVRVHS